MNTALTGLGIGALAIAGTSGLVLYNKKLTLPCGPCEKEKWWYKCSEGTGEGTKMCDKYNQYTKHVKDFTQEQYENFKKLINLISGRGKVLYGEIIKIRGHMIELVNKVMSGEFKTLFNVFYEQKIKPYIVDFVTNMKSAVSNVIASKLKEFDKVIEDIKKMYNDIVNEFIIAGITKFITDIRGLASDISETIIKNLQETITSIKVFIDGKISEIKTVLSGVVTFIENRVSDVKNLAITISGKMKEVIIKFNQIIGTINTYITNTFKTAMESIEAIIKIVSKFDLSFDLTAMYEKFREGVNVIKTFVIEKIIPDIRQVIEDLIDNFIKGIGDLIIGGVELIFGGITTLITVIKTGIDNLIGILNGIIGIMHKVKNEINGILGIGPGLANILYKFLVKPLENSKNEIVDIIEKIKDGLTFTLNTDEIKQNIEKVKEFIKLDVIMDAVQNIFIKIIDVLPDALMNVFDHVVTTIQNVINSIVEKIQNIGKNLYTTLSTATTTIKNGLDISLKVITTVSNAIISDLYKLFETVVNTLSKLVEDIQKKFIEALNTIKEKINKISKLLGIDKFIKFIESQIDELGKIWDSLDNLIETISGIVTKNMLLIKSFLQQIITNIKNVIYNVMERIFNFLYNDVYQLIVKMVMNIYKFITDSIERIINMYKTVQNLIYDLVTNAYKLFIELSGSLENIKNTMMNIIGDSSELINDSTDIIKYKSIEVLFPKEYMLIVGVVGITTTFMIISGIILSAVGTYEIIKMKKK